MQQFQVRKDNFNVHRLVNAEAPAAGDGEILVAISQFAMTANNITYAVTGDQLGYWQFFPAVDDETGEWGVIPVWGFAEVVESNAPDISVGEKLYGYFPPATSLVMTPTRVSEGRFQDGTLHRSKLPPVYNSYRRVNAEPNYDPATDGERMLLNPLFVTSWCLWDALQDHDWYGAQQVVVVSASSKTSIGLSCALHDDSTSPTTIGLTSAGNLDFVNSLGTYDRGVTYDNLTDIDNSTPTVIVDMSGNSSVMGQLHVHLGDNMVRCINVGITHWSSAGPNPDIIAARSEMFFAPSHVQKRTKDWGPAGFDEKVSAFMAKASARSRDWMTISPLNGLQALTEIYPDVSAGRISGKQGLVVELTTS